MTLDRPLRLALQLCCLLVVGVYAWMMDLNGITTDEGFRLWIVNGGQPASAQGPSPDATWPRVLAANAPYAHQPLYFLLQNTVMHLAGRQDLLFFRGVNLVFLWVALQGLLALSRGWRPAARFFLLGLFSFNAFLFMHALQIREYLAGVAFYVWISWLVLRLDARRLERPRADAAWFALYGLALAVGFYLQTWTVFPALAQGLFLVVRRPGDRLRFWAHLALSYVVVVSLTWPFLQANQQKVNIGLWASENASLLAHLSDGFHLVLAGHLAGQHRLTDALFWFWTAVLAGGGLWFCLARPAADGGLPRAEIRRQGLLMLLCLGCTLAFQIGYALKIENLSLWPRYFIVHYFFAVWLLALLFHHLLDLRAAPAAGPRRAASLLAGAMAAMLAVSACFQVASFRRDPMLDTSQTLQSNWRIWSAGLAAALRPDDAVLMHDFVSRATLTFARPLAGPVLLPDELPRARLAGTRRLVYLEAREHRAQRPDFAARAAAAGFPAVHEAPLHGPDGNAVLPEYRLVFFTRE